MPPRSKAQKANLARFKAGGSKVHSKALLQQGKPSASWWLGKTREELAREVEVHAQRMRNSHLGRHLLVKTLD